MSNTTLNLIPLKCPRCGRPMAAYLNGGASIYLKCESDAPKCGLLAPAETAAAWAMENRPEPERMQGFKDVTPVDITIEGEKVRTMHLPRESSSRPVPEP